jgi:hypothetical protein
MRCAAMAALGPRTAVLATAVSGPSAGLRPRDTNSGQRTESIIAKRRNWAVSIRAVRRDQTKIKNPHAPARGSWMRSRNVSGS